MSSSTLATSKPASKRPVAHRFDSALDYNDKHAKRQHKNQVVAVASASASASRPPSTTLRMINPQLQSRLFALPAELRLEIYSLVLTNDTISRLSSHGGYYPATAVAAVASLTRPTIITPAKAIEESAIEPAFLRTCHLARQEGQRVWHRENDFVINRRDSLDFQHPLTMSMNPAVFSRHHGSATPPKTVGNGSGSTGKSKTRMSSALGAATTSATTMATTTSRTSGAKWLYAMPSSTIAHLKTVVLVQLNRGMYKDARNEWRRDASAAFRIRFLDPAYGYGSPSSSSSSSSSTSCSKQTGLIVDCGVKVFTQAVLIPSCPLTMSEYDGEAGKEGVEWSIGRSSGTKER